VPIKFNLRHYSPGRRLVTLETVTFAAVSAGVGAVQVDPAVDPERAVDPELCESA
jgi:hypothetical protein